MVYLKFSSCCRSAEAQSRVKFEDATPELGLDEIYDLIFDVFVFLGPCTGIKVSHKRLLQREGPKYS